MIILSYKIILGGMVMNSFRLLYFKLHSQLTEKERIVINLSLKHFEKSFDKNITTIDFKEISNHINIRTKDEAVKIFNKLLSKKISYEYIENNNYCQGYFSFFSSLRIYLDHLEFSLSHEIIASLDETTIYHQLGFFKIIQLKNNYSIKFYINFLITPKSKVLTIDLHDLKLILEVEDKYPRFHDFESNILKKIVKDINKVYDSHITYNKIKQHDGIASKVTGVELIIDDKNSSKSYELANNLISLISDKITNYGQIYNLIFNSVEKNGYPYTLANIEYAIENQNDNINELIIDALINNLSNEEINQADDNFELISDINKRYLNINQLILDVTTTLNTLGFTPSFNPEFTQKIHILRKSHKLSYKNNELIIYVNYSKNFNSQLKVYVNKGIYKRGLLK